MTAATRDIANSPVNYARNVRYWVWEGLDGDDVGAPAFVGEYSDLSVQISASGGSTEGSATTVLQGSNDPIAGTDPDNAEWANLVDIFENNISQTTGTLIFQVAAQPMWVRPSQSGGSSGDLDVIVKGTRS